MATATPYTSGMTAISDLGQATADTGVHLPESTTRLADLQLKRIDLELFHSSYSAGQTTAVPASVSISIVTYSFHFTHFLICSGSSV